MDLQQEQDMLVQEQEILFPQEQEPYILADVKIETLAIDGICGVY